jgi:hypothetical protein
MNLKIRASTHLERDVEYAHCANVPQARLDADRAKIGSGGAGAGGEEDAEQQQQQQQEQEEESDTPMCTGDGERDGKRARQGDEGLDAADVELSPAGSDGTNRGEIHAARFHS